LGENGHQRSQARAERLRPAVPSAHADAMSSCILDATIANVPQQRANK
jgi:hypothetical protein